MRSLLPQRSRTKLRRSWGRAKEMYSGISSPSIGTSSLAAAASRVSQQPNLKVRCVPLVHSMSTSSECEVRCLLLVTSTSSSRYASVDTATTTNCHRI